MGNSDLSKAYKELYILLQNSTPDIKQKIPDSFMEFLEDNMDVQYEYHPAGFELNQMGLSEKTKELMAFVYRSFLE